MPAEMSDRCGFPPCGDPLADHPPRTDDQGHTMWPCDVPGCGCEDFAYPGSFLEIGDDIPIEPGDARHN